MELQRKLVELGERYQMEAVLRPLLLVRVQVLVLGIQLNVQRKRAERVHTVYWNRLNKQQRRTPGWLLRTPDGKSPNECTNASRRFTVLRGSGIM